ncbi:hypothetical protein CR513_17072, partial [Mucuna pruriens]
MAYNQADQERKIKELCLEAYENSQIYKAKVKQFHDNRILRKEFKVSQKVLLFHSRLKLIVSKLCSRWDRPFVITNVFPYGAIELKDEASNKIFQVSRHQLKHFHEGPVPMVGEVEHISLNDGEVANDSSHGKTSTSSEPESRSDNSCVKGDLLINRRCYVLGNLCSIIIYWGSCMNVASERLVRKLSLPTIVEVAVTLKRYEDKVLCDVVPMEAAYLLLGRKVIHDGVTNRSTSVHMGQKVVLKPLSPRVVQEDQNKMSEKRKKNIEKLR